MHELSLTQNLVATAEEFARRENAAVIISLTLQIGALSGVVPEAVEFAFDVCSKGTHSQTQPTEIN